jgi:hypothetical protein
MSGTSHFRSRSRRETNFGAGPSQKYFGHGPGPKKHFGPGPGQKRNFVPGPGPLCPSLGLSAGAFVKLYVEGLVKV